MQNNVVRTFESSLFGSIYTFTDTNGAPWFVGKQVAEKLGYAVEHRQTLSQAFSRHCPDRTNVNEMSIETIDVLPQGVRRNSALISEGDLYRLVIGSTLEDAVVFQNWVVTEVLPSIRQHGGYNSEQASMEDQYADPELFQRMNDMHAEFSGFMREQMSFNQQLMGSITELVRVVANRPAETPLRPMPSGHTTLDVLYQSTNGVMSRDAFKSLLRGARWPRGTYERALECGRVVELTSYPVTAEILGQEIHINQLVERTVRDARQITTYYYEHPLVTGRFRINR
ncbi:MAG: BRO-N domain-containing protein [Cetobacterium sp.]